MQHASTSVASLAYAVCQHRPGCGGEELVQRIALLRARDYAVEQVGQHVSDLAHDLICWARDVARAYVYTPAATDSLALAIALCRHLVRAAEMAEQLEQEAAR